MSKPQHRTAEYRTTRKRLAPLVAAGQAYCSEPHCLMPTRWIPPGTTWHLSHDPSGTVLLGPSHSRCNLAEANRRRARKRARWVM